MLRTALYAGTFDPVTNGHLDVVGHAVRLADKLVIAVGVHPGKAPLFSAEDRLAMLKEPAHRSRAMPDAISPASHLPTWSWRPRAKWAPAC
jgi:pantetheine-phosphate adenylyltransferase